MTLKVAALALAAWLTACATSSTDPRFTANSAPNPTEIEFAQLPLRSAPTQEQTVGVLLQRARYTVIVFFSHSCPCMRVHDKRISELAREFDPLGIQTLMIDSEFDATIERAQAEAAQRAYPFPLFVDDQGRVAQALGARYASQAVVLDQRGRVHYAGGIDSDKNFLRDDHEPYLRNALRALIRGEKAPVGDHRALGCGLRLR